MGISLKGDIPILLSADSVDVHSNPNLFNLGSFVSARLRICFAKEGQNWRIPFLPLGRNGGVTVFPGGRKEFNGHRVFFHACRYRSRARVL
jgi:hypothetical protein